MAASAAARRAVAFEYVRAVAEQPHGGTGASIGSARTHALAARTIAGIAWDTERGIPWVGITVALGFVFLFGQWMAWGALQARGFHVSTAGPSPFFYLLTGAHAIHLAVGILILSYAGTIALMRRGLEHRRVVVEVAAWYWHFMGVLWLYIFALLEFGP